jgi:hypothetical protein
MPSIPNPLFALVGATDVVTSKARTLPEKLAEIELRRFERPKLDSGAFDPRKVEYAKLDPRKMQLPKFDIGRIDLRKVEVSDVASSALVFAAKAEQAYEDCVTRGEQIVARVRGSETVAATPIATPNQGSAQPTTQPTKPPTKPAAKRTATKPPAPGA